MLWVGLKPRKHSFGDTFKIKGWFWGVSEKKKIGEEMVRKVSGTRRNKNMDFV